LLLYWTKWLTIIIPLDLGLIWAELDEQISSCFFFFLSFIFGLFATWVISEAERVGRLSYAPKNKYEIWDPIKKLGVH